MSIQGIGSSNYGDYSSPFSSSSFVLGGTNAPQMTGTGTASNHPSPLTDTATTLGISASTLQSDLQSGESLSAIVKSQGLTNQEFLTSLQKQAQSSLDSLVSNGILSSSQESSMLSGMTSMMTQALSSNSITQSSSTVSLFG